MTNQESRQIKEIVAENIRSARASANLTQRQLARVANDVDSLAVYRWERGDVLPNPANFSAMAAALGREVAWFYTDHSTSNGAPNGKAAA